MTQNTNARGFLQVLPELRGGELIKEINEALIAMGPLVEELQKGGSISIKLDFKPTNGGTNAVMITDTVSVKLPKPSVRGTIMFTDTKGSLTRNDPNQLELQGISIVRHKPTSPQERAAGADAA